jgi:hypothetical protein
VACPAPELGFDANVLPTATVVPKQTAEQLQHLEACEGAGVSKRCCEGAPDNSMLLTALRAAADAERRSDFGRVETIGQRKL